MNFVIWEKNSDNAFDLQIYFRDETVAFCFFQMTYSAGNTIC